LLDAEKVYKELIRLTSDKEMRKTMGEKCHNNVKYKFSIEAYSNRLEEVYNSSI